MGMNDINVSLTKAGEYIKKYTKMRKNASL